MNKGLPPIYRDIRRLLTQTEQLVLRFSRYHKYTVGADLRRQAMGLMRRVHRACFDKAKQPEHIAALVWQVDDFKLTLQLAMDVGAFHAGANGQSKAGFHTFEAAAVLAASIGKQCGGWYQASRSPASAGRSGAPAGSQPAAQPQANPASLSACATSHGVNLG